MSKSLRGIFDMHLIQKPPITKRKVGLAGEVN
jgi:hypothetical protein